MVERLGARLAVRRTLDVGTALAARGETLMPFVLLVLEPSGALRAALVETFKTLPRAVLVASLPVPGAA